jgi:hypothetical protein
MSRERLVLTPLGEWFYAVTLGALGVMAFYATVRVFAVVVIWVAGF